VLGVLVQFISRLLHAQIELLTPQGNKLFIKLRNTL
jgi:hypothetical protein